MLRKAAHIIITIYILVPLIGFSINTYHCGVKGNSFAIDNMMDDCGCDMACGMCEVNYQYVHIDTKYVAEHNQQTEPKTISLCIDTSFEVVFLTQEITTNISLTHGPPYPKELNQRLALTQSFRC